MYFRDYGLSKTWLKHSLKTTVLEHLLVFNMLEGRKHSRNLYERSFIIFF